jgi:hypothetical protein
MSSTDKRWSTEAEIKFLEQLGGDKSPAARIHLLVQYLDNMHVRTDWGHLNPERIKRAGQKILTKLRKSL